MINKKLTTGIIHKFQIILIEKVIRVPLQISFLLRDRSVLCGEFFRPRIWKKRIAVSEEEV